ncbi:MAG: hypothetical protein WCA83_02530 [Azonexus sp.]
MEKQINTVLLARALLLSPLVAQAQATADTGWKFSLMPYLWLPTINGKLELCSPPFRGFNPNMELDADNYL